MRIFMFAILLTGSAFLTQKASAEGLSEIEVPSNDAQEFFIVRNGDDAENKISLMTKAAVARTNSVNAPVQVGVTSRLRRMYLQGFLGGFDYRINVPKLRSYFESVDYINMTFSNIRDFASIENDLKKVNMGLEDMAVKLLALAIYEHYQGQRLTDDFIESAITGVTDAK